MSELIPIDWEWFAFRALWFAFGAGCMFVLMVAIAPVILSGRITAWEEMEVEPEPEPEPPIDERLAEAKETAAFYQALYSDLMRQKT